MLNIRHKHVDFARNWWYPLFLFPHWIYAVVIQGAIAVFSASTILWLSQAVLQERLDIIIWLAVGACVAYLLELILSIINHRYQFSVASSIKKSAVDLVLQADPVIHSSKSSGALIAKIGSTSESYKDLIYFVLYELMVWVVQLLTIITTTIVVDSTAGIVIAIGLFLLCFILHRYL